MGSFLDDDYLECYYAHPLAIYGTEQEKRDILSIERLGYKVLNPNMPVHARCYQEEGMGYFMKLVRSCDALAFRANPDNSIPSGVAKEIIHAKSLGKPVIELPTAISRRSLTIDETREWLKECGQR